MSLLENLESGIVTDSPEATEAVGERLAGLLPENCTIALQGDLGSGKTTLVRGIARGLGITANVTSPTYTIYTIYTGNRQLLHMDAYRLSNAHDLDSLTISEFLEEPWMMVVEWPDHIEEFFAGYTTFWIQLKLMPDHRHELKLVLK